ncbi:M20 family metallo-hydrolase [Lactobacillus sp. ESL0791]|uniref:M20 family metallo-hydrolase n=1 Tax=Lactobacillus sp. ESL0791 TaxID=2983234 RepID=UPI0023F8EFE4|nr:M20 family metallo-hydrolase [Lactobacillus sp. ESL0791]MDF7637950.1 M20 family metallo-hydrolase [Lactobacillus sp. ESL0791]
MIQEQNTVADLFQQITNFPSTKSGQNRLVYSAAWLKGQELLIKFALQANLQVAVDDYGSVYLDLVGTQADQVIATGSHMDTVKNGGRLDGLYGVLGGLQAILDLQQKYGQPVKTLRLISFCEEEGSRFNATFSGSKHYTGVSETTDLVDDYGIRIEEARAQAVTKLQQLSGVIRKLPQLPESFTELHIEQGMRLEKQGLSLGLVSGITGQRRYQLLVTGITNHAGTTLMSERHDALLNAIQLISRLQQLAQAVNPNLTFTIGSFAVWPNTSNVIPGKVEFSLDCRYPDEQVLNIFEKLMRNAATEIADPEIKVRIENWVHDQPVILDQKLLAANQRLAQKMGYQTMTMVSGAGHDSAIMSQRVPTTMIFVPSIKGISHAPAEATKKEDLARGVRFLAAALHREAY